jgi:hypothetical protein
MNGASDPKFVEVFVDYGLVGNAREFPVDLGRSDAAGLQIGNRFVARETQFRRVLQKSLSSSMTGGR